MTKNSFVVEVTFKDVLRNCSLRIELGRNTQTYMVEIVIWSSRKEKKKDLHKVDCFHAIKISL